MNDFELTLGQLRKLLEEDGSDQKAKKQLIEGLILEFEDDAECPLDSLHKAFFKLLLVKDVEDTFKFYAKGVLAYEKNIRSKSLVTQPVLAQKVPQQQPTQAVIQTPQPPISEVPVNIPSVSPIVGTSPTPRKKNKRI